MSENEQIEKFAQLLCEKIDGGLMEVTDLSKEAREFLTEEAQTAISAMNHSQVFKKDGVIYISFYLSLMVRTSLTDSNQNDINIRNGLKAICEDLNVLAENGLVHSSLAPPSCLDLMITDLSIPKAIFCFVHVPADRHEDAYKLVKHGVKEGDVGEFL